MVIHRYTDKSSIGSAKKHSDFIVRNYYLPPSAIIAIFILLGAASVAHLFISLHYILVIGINCIVFGGLAAWVIYNLKSSNELINAADFMSTVFAQAARRDALFSIIIREDFSTIYTDSYFMERFGSAASGGVSRFEAMLSSGVFTTSEQGHIKNAVIEKKPLEFCTSITDSRNVMRPVLIKVQPFALKRSIDSLDEHANKKPDYIEEENVFIYIKAMLVQDNKTKNHEFFDNITTPVYALTPEGYFDFVNASYSEMLGYGAGEILNHDVSYDQVLFDLDHHQSKRDEAENFATKKVLSQKNGELVTVFDYKLRFIHTASLDDYYVALPVMAAELTDRYGVFWHFFDNSPVAQVILDASGNVMKSNQAFYHMVSRVGHEGEWNFFSVIASDSASAISALLKNIDAIRQEDFVSRKPIEIKIRNSNEEELTNLLYITPINNLLPNSSDGVICHLINTTEQKNLEMHFVHSQKMQAIGQLAGGIAHDFNNLLTAMIGFCDLLLLRHPAGDQSFADIMQIKQNSNRAANLVRQLLAFSRKQVLQPEILDITNVLAESSNLVRRLIGENIELKMVHGRDLRFIKADLGQIEQVIINLAVNARDAMIGGGVLTIKTNNIEISDTHPVDSDLIPPFEDEIIANGEYVLIEISDTGCGIAKELISKIFEPFFSTKEIGAGTGLGLSTVYGIVKQTGGYIYLKTAPGIGTSFYIFLKGYNELKTTAVEEEQTERLVINDLSGSGTILLVEDEDPVRIFSAHALTNKGYKVVEASSGEEALQIVDKRGDEIDIVITDVIMPGINGPKLIEEINKRYPGIKVIFISGYAENALVQNYGTDGKFNFLAKPFTLKQLASKVKEVLIGKGVTG